MNLTQIIALVSLAVALYGAWKAFQRTRREALLSPVLSTVT
jgi:hypothetical protein